MDFLTQKAEQDERERLTHENRLRTLQDHDNFREQRAEKYFGPPSPTYRLVNTDDSDTAISSWPYISLNALNVFQNDGDVLTLVHGSSPDALIGLSWAQVNNSV